MSDDKLLKAIADAARNDAAQDRLDPRWDQYSAGTLDDDEREKLLRDAAQRGEPEQTEAAFRPMGEQFRQQLAEQAKATLTEPVPQASPPSTVTVLPTPRRSYAPLAMAASLLAVIGVSLFMWRSPDIAPIPGYVAALQGGSEFRSELPAVEVPNFQPGDRLELTLTPDTAIIGEVRGRVIAVKGDQVFQLDQLKFQFAPSGAARLVGRIGAEIPLSAGDYRLLVAIGREEALPSDKALRKVWSDGGSPVGKGWQAWRFKFKVSDTNETREPQ